MTENSVNGTALAGANVAHSHGSDTAYYNPANMTFMDASSSMDIGVNYIGLSSINYKNSTTDINGKKENFFIPSLHYVSNDLGNTRIGFAIVTPGGLTKRWSDIPAIYTAEEFTLETVEFNPNVAYQLSQDISVAFGLRALYASGVVKSSAAISRDLKGRSIDYGYNLALSYKPNEKWDFAATYRSKVDLTIKGSAKLYFGTALAYDGGASVSVPIPAELILATAYNINSDTTVEFAWERDFWSAYEVLDFNYERALTNPILQASFDNPIVKNWKDVDTYRLGLTRQMNKDLILMGGLAYDQTPIPDSSLGFELPDMSKISISFGGNYKFDSKMTIGLSTLYSTAHGRSVVNTNVNGEFSNASALVISMGIDYKF